MERFVVVFINRQGVEIAIPTLTFDVIHTNGDLTLSPTRLDGKEICIESSRIVRYEMRALAVTNGR
jgi:hypothetical protein